MNMILSSMGASWNLRVRIWRLTVYLESLIPLQSPPAGIACVHTSGPHGDVNKIVRIRTRS